jgi:hypothetical protein
MEDEGNGIREGWNARGKEDEGNERRGKWKTRVMRTKPLNKGKKRERK